MESLINLQDLDIRLPSKFSPVRRDISIVVDKDIQASDLVNEIKSQHIDRIIDFYPFDLYQGDSIENNKKSIAFLILMQDTYKTLEGDEVNKTVDQVLKILQNKFKVKLR